MKEVSKEHYKLKKVQPFRGAHIIIKLKNKLVITDLFGPKKLAGVSLDITETEVLNLVGEKSLEIRSNGNLDTDHIIKYYYNISEKIFIDGELVEFGEKLEKFSDKEIVNFLYKKIELLSKTWKIKHVT